jgi:phosphoglycerate transport regulatory protein PgtC
MKRTTQWFAVLLLAVTGSAAAEQLTVMTSYPREVVSRFEEAFENRHPEIPLQILWRMPHDALPYLLQPKQGGVDVYWTPSVGNFIALKAAGALGPIGIDRSGLPERIGDALLSDPEGTFLASETAGYGLFIDPERLAKLGVAEPKTWGDLADPRLKGQVALPVPSGVGYAPMLVDQLLQAEGWEAGWNTWRAIAVNSRLINSRGNFVTEEVSTGRVAGGNHHGLLRCLQRGERRQRQVSLPGQNCLQPRPDRYHRLYHSKTGGGDLRRLHSLRGRANPAVSPGHSQVAGAPLGLR